MPRHPLSCQVHIDQMATWQRITFNGAFPSGKELYCDDCLKEGRTTRKDLIPVPRASGTVISRKR